MAGMAMLKHPWLNENRSQVKYIFTFELKSTIPFEWFFKIPLKMAS